jgi:hypothetical protein
VHTILKDHKWCAEYQKFAHKNNHGAYFKAVRPGFKIKCNGNKNLIFFSMARKRLTDGQQTVLYIVTDH